MRTILRLLLALPLAGCGMAGIGGMDKFDGRWVADVGPRPGCCPVRVVLDVDGHGLAGSAEDCHGIQTITGHVERDGSALLKVGGKPGHLNFSGEDFAAPLPGDACGRVARGNRGG